MGKHTPGPWTINRQGYIMASQPETAEEGEELPPEYEVASLGDGSPRLTQREQADARLIAAAPDLLEACQEVLARLDYLRSLWGDEGITRTTCDRVRAAVAKAANQEPESVVH